MNMKKIFDMQRVLDQEIVQKKMLEGHDLLSRKKHALQVELAELSNELPQNFKFWSNRQNNYDSALIELVDCLHFILSIGLEFGIVQGKPVSRVSYYPINAHLNLKPEQALMEFIASAARLNSENYIPYMCDFLALIDTLGFNWGEVEQAYFLKNDINLERQVNGY